MFRQDLFVLYVVCTIFAEDGVRFGDFCVQVRTIARIFHYLCKKSDAWPGQVQTDLAYRSPSTIFAER